MQSSFSLGLHVAIIMDGNGRWAVARGRARSDGHRAGAGAVRRVVETAPRLGIGTLTLFAFSSDNWKRPEDEVATLMRLFAEFLCAEASPLAEHGVRVSVIGRRERLPADVRRAIAATETATSTGARLSLRLAVDYSSRAAIARAASGLAAGQASTQERLSRELSETHGGWAPDVDLLIRTGGEQRLSDFLLWESAYAELLFTPRMWPDFTGADLAAAVAEFRRRSRRFGAVAIA
jgi:undecaprenyl diphosphate synthase